MKACHTTVGILGIVVFLGTGAYMRMNFPDAFQDDATMRMMFRSTHVYILLCGLINLVLGTSLRRAEARWRKRSPMAGFLGVTLAFPTFLLAFFVEPAPGRLDRPIVLAALVLVSLGSIMHVFGMRGQSLGSHL